MISKYSDLSKFLEESQEIVPCKEVRFATSIVGMFLWIDEDDISTGVKIYVEKIVEPVFFKEATLCFFESEDLASYPAFFASLPCVEVGNILEILIHSRSFDVSKILVCLQGEKNSGYLRLSNFLHTRNKLEYGPDDWTFSLAKD